MLYPWKFDYTRSLINRRRSNPADTSKKNSQNEMKCQDVTPECVKFHAHGSLSMNCTLTGLSGTRRPLMHGFSGLLSAGFNTNICEI